MDSRMLAAFENWCAQNGKDPKSIAALQIGVYPESVLALAKVQDPRATALSPLGYVLAQASLFFDYKSRVLGQDGGAIPQIKCAKGILVLAGPHGFV